MKNKSKTNKKIMKMVEVNKIFQGNSRKVLKTLPDNSVDCCITSPPYYGLRDYGTGAQIGLEESPHDYITKLTEVFSEVRRILKPQGTLWLNLGDSYSGAGYHSSQHKNPGKNVWVNKEDAGSRFKKPTEEFKAKDLIGIPWMAAFALRANGWYLRQDIIWHKPNPMPESVTDRCTKAHEYIFLLSKSNKYYFDYESIQEIATGFDERKDTMMKGSSKYKNAVVPGQEEQTMASRGHERWKFKGTVTFGNRNDELNGLYSGKKYNPKFKNLQEDGQRPNTIHIKRLGGERDEVYPIRNKRSVWTVNTKPYAESHFATFPERLIVDCIKAGCPENGIVLDPFMGAGTTALVARKLSRNYIGIELNEEYVKMANKRLERELGMFI